MLLRKILAIFLFICMLLNISCYTYKKTAYNEHYKPYYWPATFHKGQKVLITTHDDQKHFFRIKSITKEYIEGKDTRVYYKDIKDVNTRKFDLKTTLLLSPVFAIAFTFVYFQLNPIDFGEL